MFQYLMNDVNEWSTEYGCNVWKIDDFKYLSSLLGYHQSKDQITATCGELAYNASFNNQWWMYYHDKNL